MRDLAFLGFIAALLALGLKRPFLFVLAYIYVDTVSPQRLSYYLLNSIPLSMIVASLAFAGWLIFDPKKGFTITVRQWLMIALLGYAFYTTMNADFPVEALEKWDWAAKALAFAIFLPFTLRTKLRVEAAILFLVLSCSAIVIVGGLKTVMSGGGYGVLNLMVDNNSGLYESSTISTIAIALIPLILWLARYGTIFWPDWRVKSFTAALVFACLLMPIGTEARTGLVCIAVLAVLMLRDVQRRFLYLAGAALIGTASIPFLPASFTSRMSTIQGYEADQSASTRLAVWGWTLDYARENPMGGGFGAYRQNRIMTETVETRETGEVRIVSRRIEPDQGRAWHSSYFEMLGEQGFPGLILFLLIQGICLVRMEAVRRRYRGKTGEEGWIAPLATALQHFQIIYLVGAVFVAIAFQSVMLLMLGVQIGFDTLIRRREREAARAALGFAPPAAPAAEAAPARA